MRYWKLRTFQVELLWKFWWLTCFCSLADIALLINQHFFLFTLFCKENSLTLYIYVLSFVLLEFGKYEVWVFSNLINTISQYCFFVWREANMAKINQEPSRHSARLCFNSWILHHIAHSLCFFRQFDNPFKCNFISFSLTFPHSMPVGFGHLHLPGQGGALSITKNLSCHIWTWVQANILQIIRS